jgi:hypothetical protein
MRSNTHLHLDVVAKFGPGRDLDGLAEVPLDPVGDESTVGLDPESAVLDYEVGGSIEPHVPFSGADLASDFTTDSFGGIIWASVALDECVGVVGQVGHRGLAPIQGHHRDHHAEVLGGSLTVLNRSRVRSRGRNDRAPAWLAGFKAILS